MINQQTKIQLYKLLGSLRPDWQDAGIHDAVVELSNAPGSPFDLVQQAIKQASNAANRTPICITWPLDGTAPKGLPAGTPTPTPASLTTWCDEHGCNAKLRPDGEKHCCWQARLDGELVTYRRPDVSRPTAEIRKQVAAALHREAENA